jgi:hypothetical protein
MTRIPFNDGWTFRRKANEFAEMSGATQPPVAVTLPHDAMISTPRDPGLTNGSSTGYFDGGTWEYHRTLFAPSDWAGKRVSLEFEGVYRSALVYVNGALAGQWAAGYTGFTVALDDYVDYGADNTIQVEARVHRDSRWYTGAGIHRPVHLLVAEPLHVMPAGVAVTASDIDGAFATVVVDTEIANTSHRRSTVRVRVSLTDADGAVVAASTSPATLLAGDRTTLRHRMTLAAPALWSPDRPYLYVAHVALEHDEREVDRTRVRFGIRDLQVDAERGLRLNGEEVKLRGACVHHDNGLIGSAAIGRAEYRRVQRLKSAGFNAIRSSHNPLSRAMLDACDELGVLVIDEAFDQWTRGKNDFDYALDFTAWWERDIEAMVRKDRNHPSVIAYSSGNEIPEVASPHGGRLSRVIANRLRELDPTRFVTNAVNGQLAVMHEWIAQAMVAGAGDPGAFEGMGINTMMTQLGEFGNMIGASEVATQRTEEAFAASDIAGMNYTEARYELDRDLFPNRVIVGAETFSTQIDKLWTLVTNNAHVIGDFTWTGWDYLGEVGIGRTRYADTDDGGVNANYPWLLAHVGDIDITGQRRPASFYREIVFGLRAAPYIAVGRPKNVDREVVSTPWAWSDTVGSWSWTGHEGKPVSVEVYSAADEVELFLDGESLGRQSAGPASRYRAVFRTTYRPGTLVAVASSGGVETGRAELVSAIGSRRVTAIADRSDLVLTDDELAFVDIALTDAAGTVVLGEDTDITVSVEGPAVVQGFGTANPIDEHTVFTDPTHRSFDGRALLVLRPTGVGAVRVAITAGDLSTHVELVVDEAPAPHSREELRLSTTERLIGKSPS